MEEFKIPKNNYLAFDAYTLKQYIRDRLNENGVFTDQNFEGSYLSTISNILSYTFNGLMFYLNKTSSESMFSEAQLYENMNRIVKMLSYKPIGYQTATLPFTPTVGVLDKGVYFIPRYSYFIRNNIAYSFAEDIVFEKTTDVSEVITELSNQKLLFQGRFREYTNQIASGVDNEIFNLSTPDSVDVDHFNIHMYVYKDALETWEEWSQTDNLYLEKPSANKFEVRLNENKNYELKVGNNINGKKLEGDDKVLIYYLESDGINGKVGPNFLNNSSFVIFNSTNLNAIINDIVDGDITKLPSSSLFTATNQYESTSPKDIETVEEMRESAPSIYRSQLRLVTKQDYETFIMTNFSAFIHDVYVANNWSFIQERLQYLYNLGVENPMKDAPVLYAHSQFADSCNFNNVYITACPKTSVNSTNITPVLSNSQKQSIIDTIQTRKTLTTETILLDPVYMAVNVGISLLGTTPSLEDINNTSIVIKKTPQSQRSNDNIKQNVVTVMKRIFSQENQTLGNDINITQITNELLGIDGIESISTKRSDTGETFDGIKLIVYNPIYPQDISVISNNTSLRSFQFAFFDEIDELLNRIEVTTPTTFYQNIEY